MAAYKCPKCGKEFTKPVKEWPMPSGRRSKTGKTKVLTIGLFKCPTCGPFRKVTKTEEK